MTDEEIVAVLKVEKHIAEYIGSEFCDAVAISLISDTIDLINRQKSEIERLKECPKCVYEYDGEITEYCVQGSCTNFKTAEQIKFEAYKEFVERLKEKKMQSTMDKRICTFEMIDGLLNEMVGDIE